MESFKLVGFVYAWAHIHIEIYMYIYIHTHMYMCICIYTLYIQGVGVFFLAAASLHDTK